MAEYFIALNDEQHGPYPAHELPSRGMRADSRVWCEGMRDWQRADSVAELADMLPGGGSAAPSPPPPPGQYWSAPFAAAAPPLRSQYASPPPGYHSTETNRVLAGMFGIFLGGLGIHKFIIGRTGAGLTMLLISVLSCGIGYPIMHTLGLIEGIIYLSRTDAEFYQIYKVGQRGWF